MATPVLRSVLELARLAPSAHNTQPWRVAVGDDGVVSVSADPSRELSYSDPAKRDLRLGLGAFTEAARIAAASLGQRMEQIPSGTSAFSAFRLVDGAKQEPRGASLLRQRQTSRLDYSPRPLEPESISRLEQAAKDAGLRLHLFQRGDREQLRGWLFAASRESWLDPRSVRELRRWIRFDPEGALPREDGLTTHCLGLDTPTAIALQAALRPTLWKVASFLYAAPAIAARMAEEEVRQAETSALIAVLVADDDGGAHGAGLLRFWLAATAARLAIHPLSVLLDRRGWELARHLGTAPSKLVAALRIGRSVPPPRSGRLPLERFASL